MGGKEVREEKKGGRKRSEGERVGRRGRKREGGRESNEKQNNKITNPSNRSTLLAHETHPKECGAL